MNAKKFLSIAMLVVVSALVGGCHYGSSDGYRGYGSGYGSGAYREGYRDGRAVERRRDAWADSRYRYGYYGRR
jgi:hypothetical protein